MGWFVEKRSVFSLSGALVILVIHTCCIVDILCACSVALYESVFRHMYVYD